MTQAREEDFGQTPAGEKVKRYFLKNGNGCEVGVLSFGATLCSVKLPKKGKGDQELEEVTLGFSTLQEYLEAKPGSTYLGSTVGRFANRIAKGHFSLEGKEYQLAINNGPNHLHGGKVGFSHRVWNAKIVDDKTGQALEFTLHSPDGEENYPGNLDVQVVFSLSSDNELIIRESAKTDKTTICNLTNHAFFNLAGSGTVLEHNLTLNSDHYLPVDGTLIPTNELKDVSNTPFDFRAGKLLGADIAKTGGGYDHCFVVRKGAGDSLPLFGELSHGNRRMRVFTDKPGVQIYTGNFLQHTLDKNGKVLFDKQWGVCMETQFFPNSPNVPSFPSVVLSPNSLYQHTTVYQFSF